MFHLYSPHSGTKVSNDIGGNAWAVRCHFRLQGDRDTFFSSFTLDVEGAEGKRARLLFPQKALPHQQNVI